jgi:hypothetical protein
VTSPGSNSRYFHFVSLLLNFLLFVPSMTMPRTKQSTAYMLATIVSLLLVLNVQSRVVSTQALTCINASGELAAGQVVVDGVCASDNGGSFQVRSGAYALTGMT